MRKQKRRRRCLLIAGSIFVIILTGVSNGTGIAGAASPLPSLTPPPASAGVPVPGRKPSRALFFDLSLPDLSGILACRERILRTVYATLYADIFASQKNGDWAAADRSIKRLDNGLLMGHVLAERFLAPRAKPSASDLKGWLDLYADHPQAPAIHKKAQAASEGMKLRSPVMPPAAYRPVSLSSRPVAVRDGTAALSARIRKTVAQNGPAQGWTMLQSAHAQKPLSPVAFDRLRALIAAGYLHSGKLDDAHVHATAILARSGNAVPMAGWVCGLSLWQKKAFSRAAKCFEVAAGSSHASPWTVSAASYWAARAHAQAGNKRKIDRWMERAADHPHTFYGLLASRALKRDPGFDWSAPVLTSERAKRMDSTPSGKRAIALLQVGRVDLAEAELRRSPLMGDADGRETILAYALKNNMTQLAFALSPSVAAPDGGLYNAALFPIVPWTPDGGYRVDRALLHALMRQESLFDASAQNGKSGAAGLMQIMPATARGIAGAGADSMLKDPVGNLTLGQEYVETLLNHDSVGQDLLSLAIAWNAGPGKLKKWKAEREGMDDPLLFIETIPYAETRAFVERVLANYWIYRDRDGAATPSLDSVAQGRWARYEGPSDGIVRFATR